MIRTARIVACTLALALVTPAAAALTVPAAGKAPSKSAASWDSKKPKDPSRLIG